MASFTVFDDASAFGYIMDLCASLGVLLCVFSLLIIGDLLFVVVAADELELEFEFSSFNIIFVIVYFYFFDFFQFDCYYVVVLFEFVISNISLVLFYLFLRPFPVS